MSMECINTLFFSQAYPVYQAADQGMLNPSALADITGDGVHDLVTAINGKVVALDGISFR